MCCAKRKILMDAIRTIFKKKLFAEGVCIRAVRFLDATDKLRVLVSACAVFLNI